MSRVFKSFSSRSLFINFVKRTAHHQEKLYSEDKKFTTIYQLPQVGMCAAVSKAKAPFLVGLGVIVPTSYITYAAHVCTLDLPIIVSAVGFASTAALFVVSQIFNRLVGFMYISKDKEQLKISSLDLWGNRKDTIHDVRDIRDLSNPPWPMNTYCKLLNISSIKKPYKISTKFGDAVQTSILNEIFNYDFERED